MLKLLKVNYHRQLIEMMLKSTLFGALSANALTPFLLVFLFHKSIETIPIYIWLSVNVIIFILRLFVGKRATLANNAKDKNINKFLYIIYSILFISSLFHGYALWYSSFHISDINTLAKNPL